MSNSDGDALDMQLQYYSLANIFLSQQIVTYQIRSIHTVEYVYCIPWQQH